MNATELSARTKRELIDLAKRHRVRGWHGMTKAELVEQLVKEERRTAKTRTQQRAERRRELRGMPKRELSRLAKLASIPGWHEMTKPELVEALAFAPVQEPRLRAEPVASAARRTTRSTVRGRTAPRDRSACAALSTGSSRGPKRRVEVDRIVVMVLDAYWLHVFWELTPESIERSEAALGADWYQARPVLRLWAVSPEDATSPSESWIRDVPIHGGVNNWYLDIDGSPRSFRVDVGYLTERGKLHVLARSNVVTTPKAGTTDGAAGHWNGLEQDADRIFALSGGADPEHNSDELQRFFEERFRRPLSAGSLSNFGSGALDRSRRGFSFELDAELVVHGKTEPEGRVVVQGEPVRLRSDGTFTLRFSLPEGRQILPAVAQSRDGIEEQTIILAIERNTKELEPMVHDGQEP